MHFQFEIATNTVPSYVLRKIVTKVYIKTTDRYIAKTPTCIHAYTHTRMYACIHAYMHTCIHASIHRKTYKRLERLAPKVAHISGFIWEWTSAKQIFSHLTPKEGLLEGLSGQQFRYVVKLLNGWTNWH